MRYHTTARRTSINFWSLTFNSTFDLELWSMTLTLPPINKTPTVTGNVSLSFPNSWPWPLTFRSLDYNVVFEVRHSRPTLRRHILKFDIDLRPWPSKRHIIAFRLTGDASSSFSEIWSWMSLTLTFDFENFLTKNVLVGCFLLTFRMLNVTVTMLQCSSTWLRQ